jgi:hypothetical protein
LNIGYRHTVCRKGRRDRERGASIVEYGAALLLVEAIVAVLATSTGVATTAETGIQVAICRVFGGECAPASGQDSGTGGDSGPGRHPLQAQPSLLPTGVPTPPPDYRVEPTNPPPGRAPSPPPTGPETESPPTEPPDPVKETDAVLQETQIGRETREWLRQNRVTVMFYRGRDGRRGTYYSDRDNTIYIDLNQSPEERANALVHEVHHAQHRGEPDPRQMGRDEYIDKAIDEETDGTVRQIQAHQQLQQAREARGEDVPPHTDLQDAYEDAYQQAHDRTYQETYQREYDEARARYREEHRETGKPLTPEQINSAADRAARRAAEPAAREAGERAGRQRVKDAFRNGEARQSTDGRPYPEQLGEAWDNANN